MNVRVGNFISRLSPRTLGTIVIAACIAGIVGVNAVSTHLIDRMCYEWFGLLTPVQISADGSGRHFIDLDHLSVAGRYDGDFDPESIRLEQEDGTEVIVAFIGRDNLALLRTKPVATKIRISSYDGIHAQLEFE